MGETPGDKEMNVSMIIPTGIGCEIGGHAGDSNPVAKLLASVCDNLVIHPNVVNASDINEMTDNMLYVEGSQLDLFFEGIITLKKVKSNRILVVVNPPVQNDIINSVNAARVTLGADIKIMELTTPLRMIAGKNVNGQASGEVIGWEELVNQVDKHSTVNCFDALAINTPIEVSKEIAMAYITNGGVNPWGGIEAIASKIIAQRIGIPVAHAPSGHTIDPTYSEVVDPRMSAEMVSCCYLHCVLKGLHKAPKLVISTEFKGGLHIDDLDFLISPAGCYGEPHALCRDKGVDIIMVDQNRTILNNTSPKHCIFVDNYLEAVGIIQAKKIGVTRESVTRPVYSTQIFRNMENIL